MSTPRAVVPVLTGSILAVSAAAVLVRLAPEVHPIAAAFWRCAIVSALLLPFARRIGGRDVGLTALAGLCLALHFWSWFASLGMTSVMRSTVLVCLNPIWVGLIEWLGFRQAPPGRFWIGVGAAIVGTVVMSGALSGSAGASDGALLGDALALLGGLLGAIYLVIGRRVRQRVGAMAYGSLICGAAAIWLVCAAGVAGAPLIGGEGVLAGGPAWGWSTWGILLAMALGPQLTGHVGLNYAVRYVPAATVSALLLLEPVGATILAALALGEIPDAWGAVGGAILLAGVLVAIRPARAG